MELIGFIAILAVGVTLAIVGGGGSILTVPILVYLFKLPADLSTSYSLFLVGISALFGSINYAKQELIAYRIGAVFSVPSFFGVFLVRKFLMPSIPSEILVMDVAILKDELILGVFSLVMLVASYSMIRNRKHIQAKSPKKINLRLIGLEGLAVGGITGFVGAGGGFLIIPALALLAGLPMKQAVGTSLMIISLKSLLGFSGDIGFFPIDWHFLLMISAISIAGIFVGGLFSKNISSEKLKPAFGYFTLTMGLAMIAQQIFN